MIPENFKGVRKVINAVSVIVGPKEGDTPDRAKYSQVYKHRLFNDGICITVLLPFLFLLIFIFLVLNVCALHVNMHAGNQIL